MIDLLLFASGRLCAAIGGDLFVEGLVGVAEKGRLPKGVVAATIGAFATSSPEMIVGITSALHGVPEIAFGDAVGSNIVNIALVLAIPLVMFGLSAPRDTVFRDVPFALAIYPIIALSGLDGSISASEALILISLFSVWFVWIILFALRNRPPSETTKKPTGNGSLPRQSPAWRCCSWRAS